MNDSIINSVIRIESSRDAIIKELQNIGVNVPDTAKIDQIASYISGYGVFRGTMEAYTKMYEAGKIPVGTVVIIDEPDDIR